MDQASKRRASDVMRIEISQDMGRWFVHIVRVDDLGRHRVRCLSCARGLVEIADAAQIAANNAIARNMPWGLTTRLGDFIRWYDPLVIGPFVEWCIKRGLFSQPSYGEPQ
jgi:hypothetical protein